MKIFGAAALLLLLAWAINYFGDADMIGAFSPRPSQQNAELIKAGGECVAIAEQATAHLVPKLEFQRLELAGRKANVVVRCMTDHGFEQSPAWLQYAGPIAARIASEQHVSEDEALENLKRKDMLFFTAQTGRPDYWRAAKAQTR